MIKYIEITFQNPNSGNEDVWQIEAKHLAKIAVSDSVTNNLLIQANKKNKSFGKESKKYTDLTDKEIEKLLSDELSFFNEESKLIKEKTAELLTNEELFIEAFKEMYNKKNPLHRLNDYTKPLTQTDSPSWSLRLHLAISRNDKISFQLVVS